MDKLLKDFGKLNITDDGTEAYDPLYTFTGVEIKYNNDYECFELADVYDAPYIIDTLEKEYDGIDAILFDFPDKVIEEEDTSNYTYNISGYKIDCDCTRPDHTVCISVESYSQIYYTE